MNEIKVLCNGKRKALKVGTQIEDTEGRGHRFEITEINLAKRRIRIIGTGGEDKLTPEFVKYKFESGKWKLKKGWRWSREALMLPHEPVDLKKMRGYYTEEM